MGGPVQAGACAYPAAIRTGPTFGHFSGLRVKVLLFAVAPLLGPWYYLFPALTEHPTTVLELS